MQKFDILSRDLNVMGFHFLEASAGTGKTFAIEHLVVRLLLQSCNLEKILVVTFTRASTRELKTRIQKNIAQVLMQLRTGASTCDYLMPILSSGKIAVQNAIARLEEALICFDGAPIFTIHGFCHRSLSEFGFTAGAPLHLKDPSEGMSLAFAAQVAEEILQERAQRPHYSSGQMAILLNHFKRDVNRLKNRLASIVVQDMPIRPLPSFEEIWKQWIERLQHVPDYEADQITEAYHRESALYKGMTDSSFSSQANLLGKMLKSRACTPEEWDQMIQFKPFFLEKMIPSNRKKRSSEQEGVTLFQEIQPVLGPLLQEAKNPHSILLRLAKEGKAVYQAYREEGHGESSPDQLLKQMQLCLKTPDFIRRLQLRYEAIIIDEFQDTDPVQWAIFKEMFASNTLRSVCLVGDPKQSIYAFRQADLYTYLEAANWFGKDKKKYLDTNFRSTLAVVDALNRLFTSWRTEGWMALPTLGTSLEVPPVKAASEALTGVRSDRGALHFFIIRENARRKEGRWPSKSIEKKYLFPFIAQEMEHSTEWGRFAVLVRDRYQAQDLLQFLQGRGIPAAIRKSASLADLEAWTVMEELLDAVYAPSSLSHLKKLLMGPCIGWGVTQVSGGFEVEALRAAQQQLKVLQNILQEQGFFPFFRAFLYSRWGTEERVEDKVLQTSDLYAELQQMAELLAASNHPQKNYALLWRELKKNAQVEEERFKKRVEEEGHAVQILTTHMSKGLEFDTVFALGIASRTSPKEEITVKNSRGEEIIPFDEASPECSQALLEIDAEKMRQLYVALTRAKQRVYVPLILDENRSSPALGSASPIELFLHRALQETDIHSFLQELGGSITSSDVEPVVAVQSGPPDKPPYVQGYISPVLHFPSAWIGSYTALAKGEESVVTPIHKLSAERNTHLNMPLGSETGVIIHRIMEKILNHSAHYPLSESQVAEWVAKETAYTVLDPWAFSLSDLIVEILKIPFINGLSLSQIPPSSLKTEMEFLFANSTAVDHAPAFIKGFIDVVIQSEGKYYFLDWKTNFLGPCLEDYTDEKMALSMTQHDYNLQAKIYKQALERYVKLFDNRPFADCFGGAFYIYLRGKKCFPLAPDLL